MRGVIGLVVGIVVAASACNGNGNDSADPTVPTAASSTTANAAPDVSVIPEKIDEPYLNAVLAALDEVNGDAVRIIQRTKSFPPEASELLRAIYSVTRYQIQADGWVEALARDPSLNVLRSDPGNRKTTVQHLIAATPSCVFTAVERDHSANATVSGPPTTEYVALRPIERSNDPKGLNPTSWMITADGFNPDGSEPVNPCNVTP